MFLKATDTHTTIEELLETISFMQSVLRLYSERLDEKS
jgi:hypothetical protein